MSGITIFLSCPGSWGWGVVGEGCFCLLRASFPLNILYNLASLQDILFFSGTCLSLSFELAMDSFNIH